jgi:hypothetical protein
LSKATVFERKLAAAGALWAGVGEGEDALSPANETERAELRRKALAWLREEVAATRARLSETAADAAAARKRLLELEQAPAWQAVTLRKLPADERAEWERLLAAMRGARGVH